MAEPDKSACIAMAGADKGSVHNPAWENQLTVVGLSDLTRAPVTSGSRGRPSVIGGGRGGRFGLAWPIWREPASLAAIRAMLSHPICAPMQAPSFISASSKSASPAESPLVDS
jgi:hypothetical protein